jgi:hypothetical protein
MASCKGTVVRLLDIQEDAVAYKVDVRRKEDPWSNDTRQRQVMPSRAKVPVVQKRGCDLPPHCGAGVEANEHLCNGLRLDRPFDCRNSVVFALQGHEVQMVVDVDI